MMCNASGDRLLVEDDEDGAILVDESPLVYGHLLVVAPKHSASTDDLEPTEHRRLLRRIARARRLAQEVSNRPTVAIEHGRSPTCGDPSGESHAHVHIVPVGLVANESLTQWDSLKPVDGPTCGSYISIIEGSTTQYYDLLRPVDHAARTLGAIIAQFNGIPWYPFRSLRSGNLAESALTAARSLLSATPSNDRRPLKRSHQRIRASSTVFVSGATGSGKTTVGRSIAQWLDVPAIEVGVILRLACLWGQPDSDSEIASLLWRWYRRNRIDFQGISSLGLAAAVPRLDGSSDELSMWSNIELRRLSDLARGEQAQEVLSEIAIRCARSNGAVVIGRVDSEINETNTTHIRLSATPVVRARRKRRQLAGIGLGVEDHDWFAPTQGEGVASGIEAIVTIDTTHLSKQSMIKSALAATSEPMKGFVQSESR